MGVAGLSELAGLAGGALLPRWACKKGSARNTSENVNEKQTRWREGNKIRLSMGLILALAARFDKGDSDVSVNFTDADFVHVGDTWWNRVYPFIDYSTGGSIDGQIRATTRT